MLIRFLPPLRLLLTIHVQNMRITEFSIQTFEQYMKNMKNYMKNYILKNMN